MQQFLKQPGPDPAIRTPNDSAAAMFGHLNVLVNAITALQNAPPPTIGWGLNGNNTLDVSNYIGSNDPTVNFLQFKINGARVGFIDYTTDNLFFCFGSGFANSGNAVIGIGFDSAFLNSANNVIAIGAQSAKENQGNDIVAIGSSAARKNLKDNVIAIGTNAGYNQSTQVGNNIAGVTMIATASLPTYVDHAAATNPVGGITIGNGGVAGTTYLYRRSSDNSIGYVSL